MSVINFILVFHCYRVFLLVLDRQVFSYDLFADNGVDFNTKLRDVVHRSSERTSWFQ
jgi:hypothetical protein